MKKTMTIKIAMVLVAFIFAFASAQNSVSVEFTGETIVDNVMGSEGGGKANFADSSNVDTLDITFKAVVDNVTAQVKLTDDAGIEFDSAYLEVADLFNGMLTVKFFDIGYGAGVDNSIRPDLGSHGIKFTVKPIDMLSIGLGYGINQKTFYQYAASETGIDSSSTNADQDYHAIQLDVGIHNAFVPVTVYAGTVIADGGDISGLQLPKSVTDTEKVTLYHTSAGFSADLLAFLIPGAVQLDVGAVIPMFGAATYFDGTATGDFENELNMVAILYGSVSDLGLAGLGLSYSLAFALDTHTKQTTLGDLDDDYFKELLKVVVKPTYALGQFTFGLEIVFGMVGENAAMFSSGEEGGTTSLYNAAYNRFEVAPSIVWAPASGFSVEGYFTFYNDNMDIDSNSRMKLGMTYNAAIGVEGL